MITEATSQKVTAGHLTRNAYLYVRQATTLRQGGENAESTQRQSGARECRQDPRGAAYAKYLRAINDDLFRSTGRSFVYGAAYAGDTELIELLIGAGADVDRSVVMAGPTDQGKGWTPLMIATAEGHGAIVSKPTQARANVNAQNALGRTALMFAARYGYAGMVKELLAHGADPAVRDAAGQTALMVAEAQGHRDVARVLREAGMKQ